MPENFLNRVRQQFPELNAQDAFVAPSWYCQQPSWLEDPVNSASVAYNYPLALRLRGALDQCSIERSLSQIMERHGPLRSVFRIVEGRLAQIIVPSGAMVVPLIDLSRSPGTGLEVGVQRIAMQEILQPFDLSCGPLLRPLLLRLESDHHVLLLLTHHLVCDDWSTGILLRELSLLYGMHVRGDSARLTELSLSYGDFVRWLAGRLDRGGLASSLGFWKDRLAGSNSFHHIPPDRPHSAPRSYRAARHTARLPKSVLKALQSISEQNRVTLFMTTLAVFQSLLHYYSGQEDIGVGCCMANRSLMQTEPLIGAFANVVILRSDLSGDPTFPQVLAKTREAAMDSYSYQELPFGQLAGMLKSASNPTPDQFFQAMFVMQNAPKERWDLAGLTASWFTLECATSPYELQAILRIEDGIEMDLLYNCELFEASTAAQITSDYCAMLNVLARGLDNSTGRWPAVHPGAISRSQELSILSHCTPSKDEIESRLLELWENAFKKHPIGITDNFFELGGDSLLATRLFAQIEKTFKIKIPLAVLFSAATIKEIAAVLRKLSPATTWPLLVPIQPQGPRPPLFCAHGIYGEVMFCGPLAGELGSEQPVFGLQSRGLHGPPHFTIAEMAADYLKEVRAAQPQGPYFLCGYCFGGLVAYEMACQLREQGEEVAFVAMINTPFPSSLKPRLQQRMAQLAERAHLNFAKFRALAGRQKLAYVQRRLSTLLEGIFRRSKTRVWRAACTMSGDGGRLLAQRVLNVSDINLEAARNYVPLPYSGRVTFFSSEQAARMMSAEAIPAWNALAAGGLEVETLPGDDESTLEAPNGLVLVEKLKSCLIRAQASNRAARNKLTPAEKVTDCLSNNSSPK